MTRNVDVAALTTAAKALRDFDDQAAVIAGPALDEIARVAQGTIRARARRHRVTGKMARLVSVRATGKGTARVVRVHAGGRVAHLITGGTRWHDIRPLHADALHLAGPAESFAAVVHHPGTKADPFVNKGIADARPAIVAIVQAGADRLAANLARDMRS